jgi:hypothetical protein
VFVSGGQNGGGIKLTPLSSVDVKNTRNAAGHSHIFAGPLIAHSHDLELLLCYMSTYIVLYCIVLSASLDKPRSQLRDDVCTSELQQMTLAGRNNNIAEVKSKV